MTLLFIDCIVAVVATWSTSVETKMTMIVPGTVRHARAVCARAGKIFGRERSRQNETCSLDNAKGSSLEEIDPQAGIPVCLSPVGHWKDLRTKR